jgi:LPXTG-motif cell wall-anchored protein
LLNYNRKGVKILKIEKRLSVLVSFMLLFMITFPVTGAFAAENSGQEDSNVKKEEQGQKNSKVAAKTTNQKEKSNSDIKAASTESKTNSEKDSETETIAGREESSSEQDTANESEETENSANQEGNSEEANNPSEEDNASDENNAPVEDNTSEENNGPVEENASDENDAAEDNENESAPADDAAIPGDENNSTQIHLHIDKCVKPVETAFVQVNGEWEEMTNPGSSPLYKSFDDGEFIKDDLTAFKLIFTTGEEIVVPVSEVRVGVEAEGSVNYWLEICELPIEEPSEPDDSEETEEPEEPVNVFSMIRIMIDDTPRQVEKVRLIMMSGKRVDFERVNDLFCLTLTEEIELDLIRGIEMTSKGETKLILLSQIESLEIVKNVLTLQLNWDMEGEVVEEETDEAETEDETDTTAPGNNSGTGNTSDGTTNEQVWNGEVLPQTGESSRTIFYLLGFLIAAGGVMLGFRNPLRN